jgi:hypothetical protein
MLSSDLRFFLAFSICFVLGFVRTFCFFAVFCKKRPWVFFLTLVLVASKNWLKSITHIVSFLSLEPDVGFFSAYVCSHSSCRKRGLGREGLEVEAKS